LNTTTTAHADLLLVDDDAPTRRYFELALRELSVSVRLCATPDNAIEYLVHHAPRFVVSDLNFTGETAMRLAEHVAGIPAGTRPTFILMSGGLSPDVEHRFRPLGVSHFWNKPVPLDQLRNLVRTWRQAPSPAMAQTQAIDRYFSGNERLYTKYRNQTIAQLPRDIEQAETAWSSVDANAMRAVLHNLKTVLQLIGQPDEAALAARMDLSLQQSCSFMIHTDWHELRDRLIALSIKGTYHE
jgi:DNA-binding NtrC family response regulator